MTIELDKYLVNFKTLTTTKQLLDEYYLQHPDDTANADLYEDRLQSLYPWVYKLYYSTKLIELTNEELYFIATSAYNLSGTVQGLLTILYYLNLSVESISYTKHKLEISINLGNIKDKTSDLSSISNFNLILTGLNSSMLYYINDSIIYNRLVIDWNIESEISNGNSIEYQSIVQLDASNNINTKSKLISLSR